jgi:hypothetical protein
MKEMAGELPDCPMERKAIRTALPYFVGLGVAAILYIYARQIEYAPRPGLLGPDFWPNLAIALMSAACLWEIVRIFAGKKGEARGVAESLEKQQEETQEQGKTYPALLIGGIVLVVGYALVVDTFGFLLATFLFITAFMYVGGYRNHVMAWAISATITILVALIFMRVAYVSLPRGTPPFDVFTDFIRLVVGG